MEENEEGPQFDDEETKIRAAYGIVKYKILESYYKVQEHFTNYYKALANNEDDVQTYDDWLKELKLLYLRLSAKMKDKTYKDKYERTITYMDKVIAEGINPSLVNLNHSTRRVFDFIDAIGITKIEEKGGPHNALFNS